MSYCTYTEVGTMLALTFGTDSVPTDVKVSDITEMISSEINLYLKMAGVDIPTIGTDLYNVVRLKAMQGSAAVVALSYYGNSDAVKDGQGSYYQDQYDKFLTMIKENPEVFVSTYTSLEFSNQYTDGDMTEDEFEDIMIGDTITP